MFPLNMVMFHNYDSDFFPYIFSSVGAPLKSWFINSLTIRYITVQNAIIQTTNWPILAPRPRPVWFDHDTAACCWQLALQSWRQAHSEAPKAKAQRWGSADRVWDIGSVPVRSQLQLVYTSADYGIIHWMVAVVCPSWYYLLGLCE